MRKHDFTLVLIADPTEDKADAMYGTFQDGMISTVGGDWSKPRREEDFKAIPSLVLKSSGKSQPRDDTGEQLSLFQQGS